MYENLVSCKSKEEQSTAKYSTPERNNDGRGRVTKDVYNTAEALHVVCGTYHTVPARS